MGEGEAAAHRALVVGVRVLHLLAHVAHAAQTAAAPPHRGVHGRVEVGRAERVEGLRVERPQQVVHRVLALLLRLGRHLPVPRLNPVLFHRQWSIHLQTEKIKAHLVSVSKTCSFRGKTHANPKRFSLGSSLNRNVCV